MQNEAPEKGEKRKHPRKVKNENTRKVKIETPEKSENKRKNRGFPGKKTGVFIFYSNTKKIKKLILMTRKHKKVLFPEM